MTTDDTVSQIIEAYLLRREEALRDVPGDTPEAARVALAVLCEFMGRYPHAALALEDFAGLESIIENTPDT